MLEHGVARGKEVLAAAGADDTVAQAPLPVRRAGTSWAPRAWARIPATRW